MSPGIYQSSLLFFFQGCSQAKPLYQHDYNVGLDLYSDSPEPMYVNEYDTRFNVEEQNYNMYYDLSDEGSTIGLRGWTTPIAGQIKGSSSSIGIGFEFSDYWDNHDLKTYSRPMKSLRGWSGDVPSYHSVEGQVLMSSLDKQPALEKAYAWPALEILIGSQVGV